MRFLSAKFSPGVLFLSAALLLVSCDEPSSNNTQLCGNGVLDSSEDCDGDLFRGQSCSSLGFEGGYLTCADTCSLDITSCTGYSPLCGNSILDGVEECDGSNTGGVECTSMGYEGGAMGCTIACRLDTSGCFGDCPTECLLHARRCENGVLEECSPIAGSNCYDYSELEDCLAGGKLCVETGRDDASCIEGCTTPCDAPGETRCTTDGSSLETCTLNQLKSCNEWEAQACLSGICEVVGETAVCLMPCVSDCDPAGGDTLRCSLNGQGIEVCQETDPGCTRWELQSSCDEDRVCNPESTGCELQGNAETCASPFFIPSVPFTMDGTQFSADVSNDSSGLGDGGGCLEGTEGGELYFSIFLSEGESVYVESTTSLPLIIQFMEDCADGAPCLLAGDAPVVYSAQSEGVIHFTVESWGPQYDGAWGVSVSKPSLL
ncbi:hypothetical protein KJ865_16025, partial [Myxococcota bacterium]|nr:hypothetical protein [Myxococcota bacterium]